ncbi:MAG: sugar kinase [Thermoplasmata archaeon HGW-Thermoplasmata-1]|nr:MAG: sugar kinase [Thermoplasmata archaeon HGW-Thermoplasmata-1]
MKLGLVCKPDVERAFLVGREIYDFLSNEPSCELVVHDRFSQGLKSVGIDAHGVTLEEMNGFAEVVVTVGGDGTILKALTKIDKPIFAINTGDLGFLTECEPKYAADGLKRVIAGDYIVQERMKLKVTLDGRRLTDSANEVSIHSPQSARVIRLEFGVDGEVVETIKADGIIIAAPTGSTGYALSVGGPILDPEIRGMVIAPIAPFRLSSRPIVVSSKRTAWIRVMPPSKQSTKPQDAKMVIDGLEEHGIDSNSEVRITESEIKARFVRFGGDFYFRVRTKLTR